MYEPVRLVLTPIVMLGFRGRCIAADNVPGAGPVSSRPTTSRTWTTS